MMIKKFSLQILIWIIAIAALTSCGSGSKFDRQKWHYGNGLDFPLRNDILEDLLQNHHIKGLNYRQVIDSLGSPQRRDSLKFTYQILDNSYEFGRKSPIHKKNLIIYFNKDSIAVRTEVYDHTDKKK
jgi:outer membrane protein assembly factor BamE (lipoprotein component of BamABCDE complex)